MGQSQTWFMYGRDDNDNWLPDPLFSSVAKAEDANYHMGRFKHKFFEYALNELDNVHKLYLYQGRSRFVKCSYIEDTLKVEFCNNAAKTAWSECRRSKKGLRFDEKHEKMETNPWNIVFKKKTLD